MDKMYYRVASLLKSVYMSYHNIIFGRRFFLHILELFFCFILNKNMQKIFNTKCILFNRAILVILRWFGNVSNLWLSLILNGNIFFVTFYLLSLLHFLLLSTSLFPNLFNYFSRIHSNPLDRNLSTSGLKKTSFNLLIVQSISAESRW